VIAAQNAITGEAGRGKFADSEVTERPVMRKAAIRRVTRPGEVLAGYVNADIV
jgi:hypothetical protein